NIVGTHFAIVTIASTFATLWFDTKTCMIRLAHFSDIHLSATPLGWRFGDWFSKRLTSWMNHCLLGRARKFALADEIVPRLMDDLSARGIDHIVFSGDATALGFEAEVRRAAEL